MPLVIVVIVGWLYVALMMSLAEGTHPSGTAAGAMFTFLLYGAAPVALVSYILMTPARRRAIKAREKAEQETRRTAGRPGTALGEPDGGGEAPADAVAPVRKEP